MASSQLTQQIPPDSWDSHMHIVDVENYALDPSATYRPTSHSLEQALAFEYSVGLHNIVLVQPSIYGLDNSCLLDGLRALGSERGRGVVAIDPEAFDANELRAWHELGVRGVRLNLQSVGLALDAAQLERQLMLYADAVRPLGWVVQVYVPMDMITLLESIVPKLNVKFCIDHLGQPPLKDYQGAEIYDIPGFSSLIRLLKDRKTYVKLSAPYRMSALSDYSDVDPIAKEVIHVAGKSQVVFATDWPHTRFEGLDIKPWMEKVLTWCGDDDHLKERLFKGNAEDLWDVKRL
ncbi:tim barrel metal-dependent hydrolase [Fusarium heterosporum]|uniref:Tim barrel metal-dependent hydrolase n=1 Tax=Fusarium heterosporum TaxID=42747 RepID=A0A8H5T5C7_FUSHE|nr:tim barrel metal-dependent hydrolase [Fusarium heterosporum]